MPWLTPPLISPLLFFQPLVLLHPYPTNWEPGTACQVCYSSVQTIFSVKGNLMKLTKSWKAFSVLFLMVQYFWLYTHSNNYCDQLMSYLHIFLVTSLPIINLIKLHSKGKRILISIICSILSCQTCSCWTIILALADEGFCGAASLWKENLKTWCQLSIRVK